MKNDKKITSEDRTKFILLERIAGNNYTFIKKLEKIKDKYKLDEIPSYKEYLYGIHGKLNLENFDKHYYGKFNDKKFRKDLNDAIGKCHQKFIDQQGIKSYHNLKKEIRKLLVEFGFGGQFIKPFLDFLLSDWWEYPKSMLNIYSVKNGSEKKIILEIDINTNLNDVKEVWELVEKLKNELWPNKKSERISLKSIQNFALYFIIKHLRNKQKYSDLIDNIWSDDSYDADVESLYSQGKIDKKRSQNLRQIIHRMKNKM